jgi:pimeloyl-ACP methyl ester carboxylesterase
MKDIMKIKKHLVKVKEINVTFYESFSMKSKVPLLLLHGGGLDSAMLSYGDIITSLGERYHVIAPDLPGYGETDKPDAPYTIEWYKKFLDEFAKVLGYNVIDLGGLSLGGGIALGYSLDHPEKVRRLILIAPYGLTDKIPHPKITLWLLKHPSVYDSINKLIISNKIFLKASLKTIVVNQDNLTDDLIVQLMKVGHSPENGRAFRVFQLSEIENMKLKTCYLNQLHNLSIPVLLLTGKKDSLVPSKDVKRASELISHSKLVEIDDCGHWLPRDKSNEFIRELEKFL